MSDRSAEREQLALRIDRAQRRLQLDVAMDEAERTAADALKQWLTAVRRIATNAPSIADALLAARDRGLDDDAG